MDVYLPNEFTNWEMTQKWLKISFSVLFLGRKYTQFKHRVLSFILHLKPIVCKLAIWPSGIALGFPTTIYDYIYK